MEEEIDGETYDCKGCGESSDVELCEVSEDDGQLICPACGCTPDNW